VYVCLRRQERKKKTSEDESNKTRRRVKGVLKLEDGKYSLELFQKLKETSARLLTIMEIHWKAPLQTKGFLKIIEFVGGCMIV